MTSPPLSPDGLEVSGLRVTYGRSIHALRGVSLRVPAGGVATVLGANGAGKSTLLRAISGTLHLHGGSVDAGTVSFAGQDMTRRDASRLVAAGIVQVPEGRRVFSGLSVEDNLRAGRLGARGAGAAASRAARDRVHELFPVLADRRRQAAGLLSGGEQQMLAMGRALMADPKLLLLDEPSLGLAPRMVKRIGQVVSEIHRQGVGVLLVEQNAALALELSDRAYVLDVGEVRLEGSSEELAATDAVRRLYLGEATSGSSDNGATAPSDGTPMAPARSTLARWSA
ncbi:ABC transporter ATP-binding protein [Streptomyces sp. NPDC055815]